MAGRRAGGMTCVIGGPDRLDPKVRQRPTRDRVWRAHDAHQIVRALVAEQLYRTLTILATLIIGRSR